MSDQFNDHAMPVNLNFADRRPMSVDIDSVIGRGRRMRRNRRALRVGLPAVAITALGVSIAYSPVAQNSVNGFEGSPIVRADPPAGGHVTVLDTRLGRGGRFSVSPVAWVSGLDLCFGAGDLASGSDTTTECTTTSVELGSSGTAVAVPHFAALPDKNGNLPAIGFARGTIATVDVHFKGRSYQAGVVPLPGGSNIEAYVVWLPSASGSITSTDISAVVAYGPGNRIEAQVP